MKHSVVIYILGRVIKLEGALMLLPIAAALLYGEDAVPMLISAVIAVCLGIAAERLAGQGGAVSTREGFVTVTLSWLIISLIGAVPFYMSGEIPSFVDAFFETVSGFTTTGASILTDVESVSRGLLLWRSLTHWIGGMGVLVFITAITGHSPDRSINILRAEMPGHSVDKLRPRLSTTAKILYVIYIALTLAELAALCLGGLPLYDSLVYSLGTAGTGGFGIKADSLGSCTPYVQWVVTVFMLLFGVSFNVYFLMLSRKWRSVLRSNELWCYLSIVLVSTAVICIDILPIYGHFADAARISAFQVSSLVTTTGYSTADFNQWSGLSKGILLLLMLCGGCMGSTSGGLKVSRVVVLFQYIKNELRRARNHRSVNGVILNERHIDAQYQSSTAAYFALYCAVIVSTFLLISFEPFGFETNFTAAVSCVNNIGPGLGLVGPMGSFADYSVFSKLVLSAAMLMGRLEMYPLLLSLPARKV